MPTLDLTLVMPICSTVMPLVCPGTSHWEFPVNDVDHLPVAWPWVTKRYMQSTAGENIRYYIFSTLLS